MAASYGSGLQSPPPIGRPVDRVFEEAQFTGEIYLNGRKLRDYPKLCSKYDLSDTILVDISRNRLTELPHEVCEYLFVERINCYHNVIRSIPDAISQLQTLTHLNLSRNQLTVLPTALCLLSALEVLSASNNKLVSLPEEIGKLENLMDLDVSCNEISHLPLQIGDLVSLRCLNLRRNFLVELPFEISRLQLFRLDFSSNRIERIPTVFRKMETLEQFILDHNPLSSPPAYICTKGRQHIMKYLHTEAIKEDRKRGIIMNSDNDMKRFSRKSLPPQQSSEEFRTMLGAPESKWKRHTVLSNDSGYSTCDGAERNGWQSGEVFPLHDESNRGRGDSEGQQAPAQSFPYNQQQQQHLHYHHLQGYSNNASNGLRGALHPHEFRNQEPVRYGRMSPVASHLSQRGHSQETSSHPLHRPPPHPHAHIPTSSSYSTHTSNMYPPSPSLPFRSRPGAPSPSFTSQNNNNQNALHNRSFSPQPSESGSMQMRPRSSSDYPTRQNSQSESISSEHSTYHSTRVAYEADNHANHLYRTPSNSSSLKSASHYSTSSFRPPSESEHEGETSPPLTPPTPPIIMTGDMEDEFTRELKRQKAEYERKKKHAEQVRVKHLEEEEEREKEERRRAALKLLEEQKLLKERMEEQRRQEEALLQEERLRLEEENRRREEEEEAARQGELLRLQESVRNQNTEDNKLRQLNEIQKPTESKPADRNKITNNYYSYTQPNSHPRPPPTHSSSLHQPPQPPTSLPLHGLSAPLSPSQTSSSTYPMPQQTQHQRTDSNYILTENEYRNALSSQSFKEQRRLATSNQYRRAASDTLKKPGQPSPNSQHVDTLNYINRNGVSENSRQSSTSTTPSVSPSPSPRNSVSQLAKPTSPSGSMSQLAKPSSPMGSMSQLAKPTGNKSSVPRANGPATAGQNQAVRRTKIAGDSSNASSPTTARSARTAGSSNLRPQGTTTLNPAASNIRRSSNSSTTDDDSKPKKGPTTPTTETSRIKSRLEEPKQRGSIPNTALKKPGVPESVDTNRRIQTRPPTNNFGSGRGRVGPKTIEDPGVVRRREEMHREEAEQMDRLRQTIETRLRVTLPDNLAEALRDGVVLCHLANQIRPRSVGSIHVPSPAVPKLTLAKCRRNVDNFLDACKKIGVDQEQICVPHDIFDEKGISRVAITVAALVAIGTNPKQSAV
ncbi:leucine-rich repeat and calponin homology domain-containing protein 4-like isoform X3 [Physella acuta]|uniref:leucine-rich repeat and calponin homology domain-containing protein 4-like isoform X3 n=1 Tax=Physella acuta TaxID=109671 RepID=UPI0027DB3D11|nr:leucine-rich repeat and calponin homology domain-containing protein 4-like isoform X3 [Physella acuta]